MRLRRFIMFKHVSIVLISRFLSFAIDFLVFNSQYDKLSYLVFELKNFNTHYYYIIDNYIFLPEPCFCK